MKSVAFGFKTLVRKPMRTDAAGLSDEAETEAEVGAAAVEATVCGFAFKGLLGVQI